MRAMKHDLRSSYSDRYLQLRPNARTYLSAFLVFQLGLVVYNLFFNLYLIRLGYAEEFMGVLLGVLPLAAMVASVPGGLILDRIGATRTLVAGGVGLAVSLALSLLGTGRSYLIGVFFLQGLALGLFGLAQGPFLYDNSSDEDRIYLFTFAALAMQVAAILGNLGGGYLPVLGRLLLPGADEITLFRVLLGIGTVLAFLSLAFLGRVKETARPAQPSGAGLSFRLPGKELRTTLQFLITGMLISFGASHFMPFMNVFFARQLLATPQQIGIIFAAAQATVAVATMITPALAKRMGPIKAITLVQALATPLLFTMSWAPGLFLTSVAFALRNALMQMANPIKGPLALGAVTKENRGKANGILVLGNSLASGVGSFSAGMVISAVGYGRSFRVAALTYAMSTALFWLFFRKMDQTPARL